MSRNILIVTTGGYYWHLVREAKKSAQNPIMCRTDLYIPIPNPQNIDNVNEEKFWARYKTYVFLCR